MAAPVQPAAAAAAALSAATAIPPPTSVQQKLELLQARTESRYRDKPSHHDYHPDDDKDDGLGESPRLPLSLVLRAAGCNEIVCRTCAGPVGESAAERRARRRRSRWMGGEHDKTFIPGLPTVLPSTLTREQEEQYLREYPPAVLHLHHLSVSIFVFFYN